MHARFDRDGIVDHDFDGVGARSDDIRAAHGVFGAFDRSNFNAELLAHLGSVGFAVFLGRAEDFYFTELSHFIEREQIGARHAAGAEDADDAGVFARKIFGAETGAAADPHMLNDAVVDDRQRFAVASGEHHDKATKSSWLDAILFDGLAFGPFEHVGLHPDRKSL